MMRFAKIVIIIALIVAAVLIIILNNSAEQVETFAEMRSNCLLQLQMSCDYSGSLPTTWNQQYGVGDQKISCREATEITSCP